MSRGEKTYILVAPGADAAAVDRAVASLGDDFSVVADLSGQEPTEHLVILAAGGTETDAALDRARRLEAEEGWRYLGLVLAGVGDPQRGLLEDPIVADVIPEGADPAALALALVRARRSLESRREIDRLTARVHLQGREMQELIGVGVALSAERDSGRLLEQILQKSREITGADAGSLYLLEPKPGAERVEGDYFADKQMRFRLTQNDSRRVPFHEFVMEIDTASVAGHTAISGAIQNVPDVYDLPSDSPFRFNKSFDESTGYRTRSMLVVPMRDHQDEIIGVVQLINRKRRFDARLRTPEDVDLQVIPFDSKCQELAASLASQAAVSLENTQLYEEIQRLFEGFIRASVTAIEARDPTTSGHSERVADLTVGLAEAADRSDDKEFRDLRFSREEVQEIRFASLLHDFGKIGVREPVLVKEKKLYAHELQAVQNRFRLIRRGIELRYSRQQLEAILARDREDSARRLPQLEEECVAVLRKLDGYLDVIVQANEPTVLEEAGFELLQEIGRLTFDDPAGEEIPYLTPEEVERLSIGKGSLSKDERLEIESHVVHTFNFLRQIPWSRDLRSVPEIAYAHHEKLNGTGYPRRLAGLGAIPVQSRMMTVSDIYDALTASDRPYKRAVPTQRALDILSYEVREGKLDEALFRLFVEAKVFEKVPVVG